MRALRLLFVVLAWIFCLILPVMPARAAGGEEKLPFPLPKSPNELPATALIETNRGQIEIEFYREEAPVTVRNFEYLIMKNFYNGIKVHRYIPDFVVQMGDPKGDKKGGPGYTLPPEFSKVKHERGTLGMARLPDPVNPERRSSGSQFYICLDTSPHLDGLYTVFARVVRGIENAEQLRLGDRILRMRLPKGHQPMLRITEKSADAETSLKSTPAQLEGQNGEQTVH